jgi:hypothetical protein
MAWRRLWQCIATQTFQTLITDLHMPNAGDGFTAIALIPQPQIRKFVTSERYWSRLAVRATGFVMRRNENRIPS